MNLVNQRFATTRGGGLFACYPLVAVYRHDPVMRSRNRPHTYRVVICVDRELIADDAACFDAVMDDFGNLVRVS